MHFPYNLLCKQIVFPAAMKHCTLWLVLRECLEPAAQQHPWVCGGISQQILYRFVLSRLLM